MRLLHPLQWRRIIQVSQCSIQPPFSLPTRSRWLTSCASPSQYLGRWLSVGRVYGEVEWLKCWCPGSVRALTCTPSAQQASDKPRHECQSPPDYMSIHGSCLLSPEIRSKYQLMIATCVRNNACTILTSPSVDSKSYALPSTTTTDLVAFSSRFSATSLPHTRSSSHMTGLGSARHLDLDFLFPLPPRIHQAEVAPWLRSRSSGKTTLWRKPFPLGHWSNTR